MDDKKRFRLFAGPNGSGKTTLIRKIGSQFNLGYFINADLIEYKLSHNGYLDCSDYFPGKLTQSQWTSYLITHHENERFHALKFNNIFFRENFMISDQKINSYHASVIADFYKEQLLLENHTFSYETVMSHASKVSYLKEAGKGGFKTYLYFICTRDPEINKQRIKNRVAEGGHSVPDQKIELRYYRSLELLYDAFSMADRAFIIDNSGENQNVLIEKSQIEIRVRQGEIPEWAGMYLLDKL